MRLSLLLRVIALGSAIEAIKALPLEPEHVRRTPTFNPFNVTKVVSVAENIARYSWEYGTLAEALLELYNPTYSVYANNSFPSNTIPSVSSKIPSLVYANSKFNFAQGTLSPGNGANGDPASLGVSAVLIGETNKTVKAAAQKQIKALFAAPRFYNGAISQRTAVAELWADATLSIPLHCTQLVSTDQITLVFF